MSLEVNFHRIHRVESFVTEVTHEVALSDVCENVTDQCGVVSEGSFAGWTGIRTKTKNVIMYYNTCEKLDIKSMFLLVFFQVQTTAVHSTCLVDP